MNHCATCKHWVPFDGDPDDAYDDPDDDPRPDTYNANVFVVRRRLGLCRKAEGTRKIDPTTLAIAQDGSDYKASFRTAAEFGCVMHEGKT